MKRLNPKTNKPFKRGDVREDGCIFFQYNKTRIYDGFFVESWLNPESFQQTNFEKRSGKKRTASSLATTLLSGAKSRCDGIPSRTKNGRPPTNGKVTIDKNWIQQKIETGICEATGDILTTEPGKPNTASLDRINPKNPDYSPENARIVTWQFNNMKGVYTDEEFIRVAEALKNVKQKSTARIPKKNNSHRKNK
jgi:hypothetical protein